jgi:hypothetical protein
MRFVITEAQVEETAIPEVVVMEGVMPEAGVSEGTTPGLEVPIAPEIT